MERPAPIVALWPPGRASHPTRVDPREASSDGWPADAEPAGHLSFSSLRAIVSGLARSRTPLALVSGPAARSVRLIATTFYDVWLITWPDGSGMGLHDHGGCRSVLQVVEGALVESSSDQVDRPPMHRRVLRAGDVAAAAPSFVHELANQSGRPALSIHAYSPPLADIQFFGVGESGAVVPLRAAFVGDRPAEASSREFREWEGGGAGRPRGMRNLGVSLSQTRRSRGSP